MRGRVGVGRLLEDDGLDGFRAASQEECTGVFDSEEHGIGRLVTYPGMPGDTRKDDACGWVHITTRLWPGGVPGDPSLHRLETACGLADRAYRFHATEATLSFTSPDAVRAGTGSDVARIVCPACLASSGIS